MAAQKKLVIVESSAKAKTINKFLGRNFQVVASNGHVKDLPKNRIGIDIENNFEAKYITISGKGKVLTQLRNLAKDAKEIFLATDPDREGETISFHLFEELKKKNPNIHRITFNEITKTAIENSMKNPGEVNIDLVDAGIARRLLDRIVGYKISPLLWKKVMRGLSAGRVQSVALKLICDREAEIETFVPEEYWKLYLVLQYPDKDKPTEVKFKYCDTKGKETNLPDRESCEEIVKECGNAPLQVVSVETKEKKRYPSPPYITSTLQQDAIRKLGFTAKRTMMIAQRLYEGMDVGDTTVGLVTYIRTDSFRVATEAVSAVRGYIGETFGKEFLPEKPNFYRSRKGVQDAHEAIRPTDLGLTPEKVKPFLDKDTYRVYELIFKRFLASQMKPALLDQTSVTALCGARNFKATGSVLKFEGFLRVWNIQETDEEDGLLPAFNEGDSFTERTFHFDQHFTQPPPRFTEASLIKTLEENGVGRPSTYAVTLSTLQTRRYVKREKSRLIPTDIGKITNTLLNESFSDIVDVEFTARLEEELDKVEEGKLSREELLSNFYKVFAKDLEKAKVEMRDVKSELEEETDIKCEKCGSPMIVKWGRYGKFLACSAFPECRSIKSIKQNKDGSVEVDEQKIDEKCPKCGKQMVYKRGRFGKFIACSGYPECKYTRSEKLGIKCPEEKCDGDIVVISGRRGKMYGCSNYPECGFRVYYKPVEKSCPACGAPVMVEKHTKKQGDFLECYRKDCKHKETGEVLPG